MQARRRRRSQNTQTDRTLEGRFLAQLFEVAPFLDDATYKFCCDSALNVRKLRNSDAPRKAKREFMRLLKELQSRVLARAQFVKEREFSRDQQLAAGEVADGCSRREQSADRGCGTSSNVRHEWIVLDLCE